jgi:hypothetical protein
MRWQLADYEKRSLTRENDGCQAVMIPEPEDALSMPSLQVVLGQVEIAFDDQRAVASAGLLLPATLAERLGIEQVTDQLIDLGDRPGAAHPGRKLLTLVHAMVAGGTASTTWSCCAREPPAACSATG